MPRTRTLVATLVAAAATGVGAGVLLHLVADSGQPHIPDAAQTSLSVSVSGAPQPTRTNGIPTTQPSPAASAPSTRGPLVAALLTPDDYQQAGFDRPATITPRSTLDGLGISVCQVGDPARTPGVEGLVAAVGAGDSAGYAQMVLDVSTPEALADEIAQIEQWRTDCRQGLTESKQSKTVQTTESVSLGEGLVAKYWVEFFTPDDGGELQETITAYVHDRTRVSVVVVEGSPQDLSAYEPESLLKQAAKRLG